MIGLQTLARFADLFAGRDDAYGSDLGACVREPVTDEVFLRHLEGRGIGIYPLAPRTTARPGGGWDCGWWAKWGCVDIDTNDMQLAWNLQKVLAQLDIVAWVEISRSKGQHVWVHAIDWIPAKVMREALLAVCQIAQYEPREVNPKSDGEGQPETFLSNYVRLPYRGMGASGRQVVLDPQRGHLPMRVQEYVDKAWANRTQPEILQAAAELYVPAPPKQHVAIEEYGGDLEDLRKRLNGIANTVFLGGPLEGSDRSSTLFKLVHKIKDSGLLPGEALVLLRDADRRYGKYYERTDCEQQLANIIRAVYG